jgi:hypothetical protein
LVFGEDGSTEQADALTRHLRTAAAAMSAAKRPRTCMASLTLVADQASYDAVPTDLLLPKVATWGVSTMQPWHLPPGPLPIITLAEFDGVPMLVLNPPPSACQIAAFGSTYAYYYFGAHQITDDAGTSTVQERDRNLLILRAQVEAMRETSMRNAHKPVTLREGGGGMTRNMTPSALYAQLLAEFNGAA